MNKFKYGVYAILVNGVIKYIGSGDIADCKSRHKSNLKNNCYFGTNKSNIQEEYNKNPKCVTYDTLKRVSNYVDDPLIVKWEDYYFNLHNDTVCNRNKPSRPIRDNDPVKREEEYRKRSSANAGVNNPRYTGKLKVPEDIIRIKLLLETTDKTQKEIAALFDISPSLVSAIGLGERYASVNVDDFNKIVELDDLDDAN